MWKERGTGDVRFLKSKETGKVRLLMRREKTMKICANFDVAPSIELKENAGSDRAWTWQCSDFSDEELKVSTLAIRFANSESAPKAPPKAGYGSHPKPSQAPRWTPPLTPHRSDADASKFKEEFDKARETNKSAKPVEGAGSPAKAAEPAVTDEAPAAAAKEALSDEKKDAA